MSRDKGENGKRIRIKLIDTVMNNSIHIGYGSKNEVFELENSIGQKSR